ncbi:Putative zinc- or iron-chelating domain protein [Candidatus Tiddalikarchaeum anstoanum]|nr:Putative zinc- or iron-chelating domain protein [Candidatus Tiddalikarchaeum anstoanum]
MNSTNTYINSDVCQKCGKCCKQFWIYTKDKDYAVRLSYLKTDKITVKKFKKNVYRILFDIPCSKLEYKKGKYYCRNHKRFRPNTCKTYPIQCFTWGSDILKIEKNYCPVLKQLFKYAEEEGLSFEK